MPRYNTCMYSETPLNQTLSESDKISS